MSPVNVLYVVRTWAFGGSHTIVLLLMKHLPRDRFNIITVPYDSHSGGDEVFVERAAKQGLSVAPERIPWKSRRNWGRARAVISDLIDRYNIDLVHTHDPHSNVLVGLGRKRWPCACVASPYGWWSRWFPLRSHLYNWVECHRALPQFDRVITVSENMKQKILKGPTPEEKIAVVNTGLDLAAMRQGASRSDARAALDIPANACVIGTVSRLYVEKGHTYLLEAAARLVSRHPEVHLLVVGSGPLKDELEAKARSLGIERNVTFAGFVDDLPGTLNAMDIFALPSILDEGFPTVSLEAQVAGLPIVASNVGGTLETMAVGETGLLVPPRNAHKLAAALESLVADPKRRQSMGAAAKKWIESKFTLEEMIEKVARAYDEALHAWKQRP